MMTMYFFSKKGYFQPVQVSSRQSVEKPMTAFKLQTLAELSDAAAMQTVLQLGGTPGPGLELTGRDW